MKSPRSNSVRPLGALRDVRRVAGDECRSGFLQLERPDETVSGVVADRVFFKPEHAAAAGRRLRRGLTPASRRGAPAARFLRSASKA